MKYALTWMWVFIVCLLAACGGQPTGTPTAGITPSLTATITPTTPLPTATLVPPSLTPTSTFTPTATFTPTPLPAPPTPVLTAPGLFAGSWSPDGRYFSFVSQTNEDIANTPVGEGPMDPPPGTFNFYDTQTGKTCAYPERNPWNLNFRTGWVGWKGDHTYQVLTYTGKLVTLAMPCVDLPFALAGVFEEPVERTLAVSGDGKLALLAGEKTCWLYNVVKQSAVMLVKCTQAATFSPGDTRLAFVYGKAPDLFMYVIDTASGLVEKLIPWTFSGDGVGGSAGPDWISESQFIIQPTDEGPRLVSLDKPPLTEIFPGKVFNVSGTFSIAAYGTVNPDNGSLHLIFHLYGDVLDKTYLYHTENHILEELPYAYVNWFDKNRSLMLCNYGAPWTCQSYWMRAVDPPASAPVLAPDLAFWAPAQSPDGRLAAATSQADAQARITVAIRSLPDLAVVKTWADANDAYYFAWSPDSRTLAAISRPDYMTLTGGGQSALYILQFK